MEIGHGKTASSNGIGRRKGDRKRAERDFQKERAAQGTQTQLVDVNSQMSPVPRRRREGEKTKKTEKGNIGFLSLSNAR